ncbi:MAG: hypothetical protein L6V84_00655 [Oscillospiraceae bacterium]|nr:MAG: hypothetical protein L6V84_00655 [Oscillospiraceae bacterium]
MGMGPAGLFCALLLARQGYAPLLIDRGDAIPERTAAVARFTQDGELDTESNIQFGAGGAGTFSDGKLLTRINDARCAFVLETFRALGAPEDITLKAKAARRHRCTARGCYPDAGRNTRCRRRNAFFRCRMDGFTRQPDGSWTVHTTRGDISAGVVVLAPGHSARDTYGMLIARGSEVVAKPISVGVRIEHRREDIDRLFYGKKWQDIPTSVRRSIPSRTLRESAACIRSVCARVGRWSRRRRSAARSWSTV